ncbi:hypothetical protein DFH11DRAFT_1550211 [Phellopilus nigrolimitatus]|nr:hypothetical protein DFH11DRAFT_1550211 [Phellopilus nigrolimitatus]
MVKDAMERADIRNIPPIGNPLNKGFFNATQMNAAGAVPFNSSISLKPSLGVAGGSHRDMGDHIASLTMMFSFGNLPGLHQGNFFLFELGIYVAVENYKLLAFKGLQYHGGSPPRSLDPDVPPPKDAIRLTFICYPSERAMERTGLMSLASASANSIIEVDRRLPDLTPEQLSRSGLNMARDSDAILVLSQGVVSQMSSDRRLYIDTEKFMSAFSWHDAQKGEYVHDLTWENAPGGLLDKQGVLREKEQQFRDAYNASECLLPSKNGHLFSRTAEESVVENPPKERKRRSKAIADDDEHRDEDLDEEDGQPPKKRSRSRLGFIHHFDNLVLDREMFKALQIETPKNVEWNSYVSSFGGLMDRFRISPNPPTSIKDVMETRQSLLGMNAALKPSTNLDLFARYYQALHMVSYYLVWDWLNGPVKDSAIGYCKDLENLLSADDRPDGIGSWIRPTARMIAEKMNSVDQAGRFSTVKIPFSDVFPQYDNSQSSSLASPSGEKDDLLDDPSDSEYLESHQQSSPSPSNSDSDGEDEVVEDEDCDADLDDSTDLIYDPVAEIVLSTEYSSLEDKQHQLLDLVLSVLAQWIGLQSIKNTRHRNLWKTKGQFVHTMLLSTGSLGIFLCDKIQQAFRTPFTFLFKGPSFEDFAYLKWQIQDSISKKKRLQKDMRFLEQILSQLNPGLKSVIPIPALLPSDVQEINLDLDTPAQQIHRIYRSVPEPENVQLPPASSLSSDSQSESTNHDGLTENQVRAFAELSKFWNELVPLASDFSKEENDTQVWAKRELDKYLPFRDDAPSRKNSLHPELVTGGPPEYEHYRKSPFSEDSVLTVQGIFSIFVFRAISFGCDIVKKDAYVFFDSVEDYAEIVGRYNGPDSPVPPVPRPPSKKKTSPEQGESSYANKPENPPDSLYLCDIRAYGNPSWQRHTSNASQLWKAAELFLKFRHDREKNRTLTFFSAHKFLNKTKECSGIGALTSYLICLDLLYAGALPAPSERDFARFILNLDLGAAGGLKDLGLLNVVKKKNNEGALVDGKQGTEENIDIFLKFFRSKV